MSKLVLMRMISVMSQTMFLIEVHDSDAAPIGRSYGDIMVIMPASLDLVENMSSNHLDIWHAFLHVHYPTLPLSAIICHLLIFTICLRGMCLTVWTL